MSSIARNSLLSIAAVVFLLALPNHSHSNPSRTNTGANSSTAKISTAGSTSAPAKTPSKTD